MLSNDAWLEQQLATELSQSADLEKLIRIEQLKVSQAKLRISKVQDWWEKEFYTPEEVRTKLYLAPSSHCQSRIGDCETP